MARLYIERESIELVIREIESIGQYRIMPDPKDPQVKYVEAKWFVPGRVDFIPIASVDYSGTDHILVSQLDTRRFKKDDVQEMLLAIFKAQHFANLPDL
ncbi:hypothetical protein JW968_00620 [Candidatus Woesearchaeota archaeon]|nr:hypothetical protein [Candidatus Woesearchaeota archaeon]